MWTLKLIICILVDAFDMTIGRLLFPVPFAGEIVGAVVASAMFGWKGMLYLFEMIDPTEQLDGFVPTATLIALASRPGRATTS